MNIWEEKGRMDVSQQLVKQLSIVNSHMIQGQRVGLLHRLTINLHKMQGSHLDLHHRTILIHIHIQEHHPILNCLHHLTILIHLQ